MPSYSKPFSNPGYGGGTLGMGSGGANVITGQASSNLNQVPYGRPGPVIPYGPQNEGYMNPALVGATWPQYNAARQTLKDNQGILPTMGANPMMNPGIPAMINRAWNTGPNMYPNIPQNVKDAQSLMRLVEGTDNRNRMGMLGGMGMAAGILSPAVSGMLGFGMPGMPQGLGALGMPFGNKR
mgnify:CR=1 FL=1